MSPFFGDKMERVFGLVFACLVVLGLELLALRVSGWLWPFFGDSLDNLKLGGLLFYGPCIVMLIVWSLAFPRQAKTPWLPRRETWSKMNIVVLALAVMLTGWFFREAITRMYTSGTLSFSLALVNAVAVAPVTEEWIFHGVLWRQFVLTEPGKKLDIIIAILITSALFGVWHLPFKSHSPVFIHAGFGLLMGIVRWRFRSVLLCILLHAVGNTLQVVGSVG